MTTVEASACQPLALLKVWLSLFTEHPRDVSFYILLLSGEKYRRHQLDMTGL